MSCCNDFHTLVAVECPNCHNHFTVYAKENMISPQCPECGVFISDFKERLVHVEGTSAASLERVYYKPVSGRDNL